MRVRLTILLCTIAFALIACDDAKPDLRASDAADGAQPRSRLTFSFGSIWQVNADGSELTRVARPPDASGSFISPTFSPDGTQIAYIASDGGMLVAYTDSPADPATRIDLYEDRSVPRSASNWSLKPSAVHWSPDGDWLLVTRQRCCGSGLADVLLVRPDGSEQRTIIDPPRLPSFPEATWSLDRSPDARPPAIVVVGGADGLTGTAYDVDGHETGAALPSRALRHGVAAHQNPAGEGALITSALGNPEPFGPVEVIDISGQSRIIGGGCGAVWSPDGSAVAFYDGYGIVVQPLDAAPGEGERIASNADLSIADPEERHPEVCERFSMTWRSTEPPTSQRRQFPELGVAITYPAHWSTAAAPMPYASCLPCTVVGLLTATHPYGIQLWVGEHQVGCPLTCYINIRALAQEWTHPVDANGHPALRQEFERQRPLGMVNEDGDNTSYREILTVVSLVPTEGLAPEAFVPAVFIDAFYRYGDSAAEAETRAALADMLATLSIIDNR